MSGWILQKKGNEPASVNTRAPVEPPAMFSVVQLSSSRVAVCGTASELVNSMTSPTAASTVDGEKANSDMLTATVPASLDGVHGPAAAGGSLAAWLAGASVAADDGALVPPPPEQAAIARLAVRARTASSGRRVMCVSSLGTVTGHGPGAGASVGPAGRYVVWSSAVSLRFADAADHRCRPDPPAA